MSDTRKVSFATANVTNAREEGAFGRAAPPQAPASRTTRAAPASVLSQKQVNKVVRVCVLLDKEGADPGWATETPSDLDPG